jgi:hypothetical protein
MDRDPYSLTLKIGVEVAINNIDFTYLIMIDSTFSPNGSAATTLTACTLNLEREPGARTWSANLER